MALLTHRDICELTGFETWAAVELWLSDIAGPAYRELCRDFVREYNRRGEPVPPGSEHIKYALVRRYPDLEAKIQAREREIENGMVEGGVVDKSGWDNRHHYRHFVVQALALDRVSARNQPWKNHITTRHWARDPVKLFAIMYDLTNTICHN